MQQKSLQLILIYQMQQNSHIQTGSPQQPDIEDNIAQSQQSENQGSDLVRKFIKNNYDQREESLQLYEADYFVVSILKARNWTNLRKLQLRNCGVNDYAVGVIVESKWPNLQQLQIYENDHSIHSKSVSKLLQAEWPKLKQIDFRCNWVGAEGFIQLMSGVQKMPSLHSLYLNDNYISLSKHADKLLEQPVHNLTILALSNNNISSRGIKTFTKLKMDNLQKLFIQKCHLNEEGVKHFVKGSWPRLRILQIGYNLAQLDAVACLSTNNDWKHMNNLSLGKLEPMKVWKVMSMTRNENSNIDLQVRCYRKTFGNYIDWVLQQKLA